MTGNQPSENDQPTRQAAGGGSNPPPRRRRPGALRKWEDRFEDLRRFKTLNGHTDVPYKYNPDPSLGEWVQNQRNNYRRMKKGKPSAMTSERASLMEELGFKWTPETTAKRSPWEARLEELRQYKVEFGDANVPHNFPQNLTLARWVHTQRQQYRLLKLGRKSRMTMERAAAMEELGFTWKINASPESAATWEERLEELRLYALENGDANVPQKSEEHPALGRWIHTQRKEYRKLELGQKSRMTMERAAALEELGLAWNMQQNRRSDKNASAATASAEVPAYSLYGEDEPAPPPAPSNPLQLQRRLGDIIASLQTELSASHAETGRLRTELERERWDRACERDQMDRETSALREEMDVLRDELNELRRHRVKGRHLDDAGR